MPEGRDLRSTISMTPRIALLKEKMLRQPRYASIEQARIITESYKKNKEAPRILQRARALRSSLEKMQIAMEPEEQLVGNRTAGVRAGVVFPESGVRWVDKEFESLPTRPQDTFAVHPGDPDIFRREIASYWEGRSLEDVLRSRYGKEFAEIAPVVKINQKDHAQGHICPDCRRWLAKGPAALLADAEEKAGKTAGEKKDFYLAVAETMRGAQIFMRRYAQLAERLAQEYPAQRENLLITAAVCDALSRRPPQTFREALQSLWFLFVILQMESNASSFSPGRMDQYLLTYYERDLQAGKLTPESALELLQGLWLKFNQIVYMRNAHSAKYFAGFPIGFNVVLGGVDEQGEDMANDLSFLMLKAQYELGLPQPNLSVRLHEETSEALLDEAVRVVARGSGMPQFFNDAAVIPALESLGVEEKDARGYAVVGCVELTTQGNNLGWSDAAMFNLNKVLELTLTGGRDLLTGEQIAPAYGSLEMYDSFEELEEAFAAYIDFYIGKMTAACEKVEQAHQELLPTPFLSAVIDPCMERGTDVTAGGAKYNFSGIQMIQVANLADSMAALRQLVFEERRYTGTEVLAALKADFEGWEPLQAAMLHRVPKYGNDVAWVDALGVKWAEYFRRSLPKYRNYRGGAYHTGMYTVSAHVPMGEMVGASPDGRRAREPLADGGMSPVYGRDITGPTAVLKSVSRLDKTLTSNGGLLNMKFLPQLFETERGRKAFSNFLRTFVDLEIPHIQFNVVRREDLLAAQEYPERYAGLTVRVAGYTAYFVELARELQNEIIARTSYDAV